MERNLEQFAAKPAIRFLDHVSLVEKQTLTYGGIATAAQSVAAGLKKLGIQKGDRVALFMSNSPEFIITLFAVWRAGAIAVPCNPMFKEQELYCQLADAGANLIITQFATADIAASAAKRLGLVLIAVSDGETLPAGEVVRFEDLLEEDGSNLGEIGVDPQTDLALLLYTGGTTGAPKGAMLTHRNIVSNVIQFSEWYAFEPGQETCVSVLPMFHSGGMAGAMNVPLYNGSTLLVMSRFNPVSVAKAVEKFRATRLFGVPTMYIGILNSDEARRYNLSSLRACRTSAAPLPPTVKAEFDRLVGHEVLVEGYGLTETSPLTHANPIMKAKPGSIGIPLPDTDAKVVGIEDSEDLPEGAAGEIVIRGPQVMKGYWKRPQETREAMRGGWFHTGDVAYVDEEGYFFVVDRLKDIINTGGYKVWPREVEEVIYAHPATKLVAVVGVEDAYLGQSVKAFVVPKDNINGRLTEEELIHFCKERLAAYKVPRWVEIRDEVPISGTGKVLRRVLRSGTVQT